MRAHGWVQIIFPGYCFRGEDQWPSLSDMYSEASAAQGEGLEKYFDSADVFLKVHKTLVSFSGSYA